MTQGKRNKPEGSGRKKGTPNKRTLVFRDLMDQVNFKPTEELVNLIRTSPKLTDKDKAFLLLDLIQYEFPKRKAIDLNDTTDPNQKRQFVIQWGDDSANDPSSTEEDTSSKKDK